MKKKIEYYTEVRNGVKFMECRCCGTMIQVTDSTTAITCDICVREEYNKQFPFTPSVRYKPSGKPRGWKFMKEYVHKDGTVYYKGVEQPELKGTIEPTKIQPKVKKAKMSKGQRAQLYNDTLSKIHKLKKQLSKAKFKKDQRRITSEIKKLQRVIR